MQIDVSTAGASALRPSSNHPPVEQGRDDTTPTLIQRFVAAFNDGEIKVLTPEFSECVVMFEKDQDDWEISSFVDWIKDGCTPLEPHVVVLRSDTYFHGYRVAAASKIRGKWRHYSLNFQFLKGEIALLKIRHLTDEERFYGPT